MTTLPIKMKRFQSVLVIKSGIQKFVDASAPTNIFDALAPYTIVFFTVTVTQIITVPILSRLLSYYQKIIVILLLGLPLKITLILRHSLPFMLNVEGRFSTYAPSGRVYGFLKILLVVLIKLIPFNLTPVSPSLETFFHIGIIFEVIYYHWECQKYEYGQK